MRTLATVDYSILGIYLVLCVAFGLYHTKKASKNVNEFFLTGRSMPWWLLGTSMAATNFSIDTPLAITKYVFREGIGGVWFFWSSAISTVLVTFFFATLWRRAEVMTDNEIVEHRYSGKPAAFLRVFKGCYFGLLINCFVMGWVLAAFMKVATGLTNLNLPAVVGLAVVLTGFYTMASGLYGVLLTDFLQYGIALVGSFLLAYFAVREVGGIDVMMTRLHTEFGAESGVTNFIPNLSESAWMPYSVFLTFILVQWWAHKYSDGGGKHIQRMSAAKNSQHAVWATFFFGMMNYVVQVWPWIITALAALLIYGRDVKDPEMTYVWMIGRQMPHGLLGVMVVTLMAAFMSTMSTHLNLGGSYFINDIYRRFIRPVASERHYVLMARVSTFAMLVIALTIGLQIQSVGNAWKFVLEFTSGAGLTWVIRWIWWRANAWTEIVGMSVSGIVATTIELTNPTWLYSTKLLLIVGISTAAWLIVTLLTKPVDEARLVSFVRKVRPGTPGWRHIYNRYNIPYEPYGGQALWSFAVGLVFFFCANFGFGATLLHNYRLGVPLLIVAAVLCVYLLRRLQRVGQHAQNPSVAGDALMVEAKVGT